MSLCSIPARVSLASAVLLSACSFVDDFDQFQFQDGGASDVVQADVRGDSQGPDTGGGTDGGEADAGEGRTCDSPCLADSLLGFSGDAQGTGSFTWRYQAQTRDSAGLEYVDLLPGEVLGLSGWSDDVGSAGAAIVHCDTGAAPCAPEPDLLLVSDADGAGADSALVTTVEEAGRYRFEITARSPATPPGDLPAEIWVSRNGRADLLSQKILRGTSETFEGVFEALAGDRFVVSVRPGPGGSAPQVGLNVRLLASATGSECELSFDFDARPILDACAGGPVTVEAGDEIPTASGPADFYGLSAEFIRRGSSIRVEGRRIARTGNFTAQMWLRVDSNSDTYTQFFQDWSGPSGLGIAMAIRSTDDTLNVGFFYLDAENSVFPNVSCADGICQGELTTGIPPLGEWHHLRVMRDTADNRIRLCIDGTETVSLEVAPGADISSAFDPKFGLSTGGSTERRFTGGLDDARFLTEALPCAPSRDTPP